MTRAPALLCLAAAMVGLALSIAGFFVVSPRAFFAAWLAAYICWLGIPLTAIAALMIHDLAGGDWGFALRPHLMAGAATLPLFIILFLPVPIAGLGDLYSWAQPGIAPPNGFYLNIGGFVGRAAAYFVVWILFALIALSRAVSGALATESAGSWLSGIGLVATGFAISFAAIDWVMSLEPRWYSSMFGLLIAASLFNTGFAFFVLMSLVRGVAAADADLRSALAHILLASTLFWAYCEFMQFLIIWEEDLVAEIPWYLRRLRHAWGAVAVTIVLGRFVVPFFTLIFRPLKRDPRVLGGIAALLLAMAQLYCWILVLPAAPGGFTWIVLPATIAIGGFFAALFLALEPRLGRFAPSRAAVERLGHA